MFRQKIIIISVNNILRTKHIEFIQINRSFSFPFFPSITGLNPKNRDKNVESDNIYSVCCNCGKRVNENSDHFKKKGRLQCFTIVYATEHGKQKNCDHFKKNSD